jgi:hypothetical protein
MPVVLRKDGFAFSFFANDHEPAHVHVRHGGQSCRIELATLLVKNIGMDDRNRRLALRLVAEHRPEIEQAWRDFQLRKAGKK